MGFPAWPTFPFNLSSLNRQNTFEIQVLFSIPGNTNILSTDKNHRRWKNIPRKGSQNTVFIVLLAGRCTFKR